MNSKSFYKRWWVIGTVFLVLFAAGVFRFQAINKAVDNSHAIEVYQMNDPIQLNHLDVYATNVSIEKKIKGLEIKKKRDDDVYIVIDIVFENKSQTTVPLNVFNYKIKNDLYFNSINLNAFKFLNPGINRVIKEGLRAQENIEVKMVFQIPESKVEAEKVKLMLPNDQHDKGKNHIKKYISLNL